MKKRQLSVNPEIDQFVEQDFSVFSETIGETQTKYVKVTEYLNSHREFQCDQVVVEVVKDWEGHVSFIVMGTGRAMPPNEKRYMGEKNIWIMRTQDFNRAYDLKNKIDTLLGNEPSKYQMLPCYGSLQREKLAFETD